MRSPVLLPAKKLPPEFTNEDDVGEEDAISAKHDDILEEVDQGNFRDLEDAAGRERFESKWGEYLGHADKDQNTLLHTMMNNGPSGNSTKRAIKKRYRKLLMLYLIRNCPALLSHPNNNGETAIEIAIRRVEFHAEYTEEMVESASASCILKLLQGGTFLHILLEKVPRVVPFVLDKYKEAHPGTKELDERPFQRPDSDGNTPLHIAVKYRSPKEDLKEQASLVKRLIHLCKDSLHHYNKRNFSPYLYRQETLKQVDAKPTGPAIMQPPVEGSEENAEEQKKICMSLKYWSMHYFYDRPDMIKKALFTSRSR